MYAAAPAAGQRGVLWHNMREEPVLYINGKPYVVRESDQPFCNVEYTGDTQQRLQDGNSCSGCGSKGSCSRQVT